MTDLPQEVDGPFRRHRSVPLHQCLEVEAVQQLHHVVEAAIVGDAKVEELHGMRRRETGGELRLVLESAYRVV